MLVCAEKTHSYNQDFETRSRSPVDPLNLVIQDKSGLDFIKKLIFKTPIKPAIRLPMEPLVEPLDNSYFYFSSF